jgi:ribosomal protein L30/L7E
VEIVKASGAASRRARNHMRKGLQALRLNRSRDRVLLGDEDGRPVAWVLLGEVEDLPHWLRERLQG